MSRLDKLKIFIEIIKGLTAIFSAAILALTAAVVIMLRAGELSAWVVAGIFLDVLFMLVLIFLIMISIQIANETEDLK